jgi:hypothetical protein
VAEPLSGRETLLLFLAVAITLLLIKSGYVVYKHEYGLGVLYLVAGGGLGFVFFRKRKIIFGLAALAFLLVSAGLTALFHPSIAGALITIGSALGLYLVVRWHARKYPHLGPKDMHKLFDEDPD